MNSVSGAGYRKVRYRDIETSRDTLVSVPAKLDFDTSGGSISNTVGQQTKGRPE